MSSRRNGSVSRAAETASKTRLHMDRNPTVSRINDPANPAGRRKEIDNVMKRARQASPGSWDRKLLEVEEKDPNRWRHTGYKQMYLNGSRSPSSRRSRSPSGRRSRSPVGRRSRSPIGRKTRSPIGRRSRSPVGRRSRSPVGRRSRSPVGRRSRSPVGRRSRSPVVRRSRSPVARRSRSPVVRKSRSPIARGRRSPPPARRSPPRRSPPRRSPPRRSRSPRREPVRDPRTDPRRLAVRAERRRESPPRRPMSPRRPPPSPRDSSGSGSSGSSCSDESCSVCSAKNKKTGPPPKPGGSPARKRPTTRPPSPPPNAVKPTRELLKAREASKRSREEKVLEWQRSQLVAGSVHVKRESGSPTPALCGADLARALNQPAPAHRPTRLTLSERFGKMAQWSAARSARLENMRITRQETTLHVHIEPTDREDPEPILESAAIGSYPEELLAAAPAGLPSWDDVRVRYDYYKKRGYLRGLTLGDYVKWEEWWYKYQEWLKRERAYERWADGEAPVRRERRRRGGRHRRS